MFEDDLSILYKATGVLALYIADDGTSYVRYVLIDTGVAAMPENDGLQQQEALITISFLPDDFVPRAGDRIQTAAACYRLDSLFEQDNQQATWRVLEDGSGVDVPEQASGADSALKTTGIAGATLSGHRVVVSENGVLQYASNLVVSHTLSLVGLTTGAVTAGQQVSVHTFGELTDPSFSFDVTKAIYLGNDGGLIQYLPDSPAMIFRLARPLSANTIFWQPQALFTQE